MGGSTVTAALTIVQEALYWAAAIVLLAATVAFWLEDRVAGRARQIMLAGSCLLLASAIARWIVTGHPPIFGTFENSIASAWAISMVVVFGRRLSYVRALPADFERWFAFWIPLTLGFGLFFTRTPYPLTISERSIIVDIHVLFAWLAYTALLLTSTVALLVVTRRKGWEGSAVDDVLVRGAGVGFALFTVMLGVGSLYSYLLFADWFRWEIVEAFAVAAWLGYASVLHAHMFFGWRGRKLAWVVLVVLPLLIGTFWVWSFYSTTYHHFEIPEIKA